MMSDLSGPVLVECRDSKPGRLRLFGIGAALTAFTLVGGVFLAMDPGTRAEAILALIGGAFVCGLTFLEGLKLLQTAPILVVAEDGVWLRDYHLTMPYEALRLVAIQTTPHHNQILAFHPHEVQAGLRRASRSGRITAWFNRGASLPSFCVGAKGLTPSVEELAAILATRPVEVDTSGLAHDFETPPPAPAGSAKQRLRLAGTIAILSLLAAGGGVLCAVGCIEGKDSWILSHGDLRAPGVIETLEPGEVGSQISVYRPIVAFRPTGESGPPRRFRGSAILLGAHTAGEEVSVVYDPSDPERARIESFNQLWHSPLGNLIGSILMGIVLVFAGREWRQKHPEEFLDQARRAGAICFLGFLAGAALVVSGF